MKNEPLNHFGETALHVAADAGRLELVKWLVQQNDIDLDTTTRFSRTALDIAVLQSHEEIAEYLLALGVSTNINTISAALNFSFNLFKRLLQNLPSWTTDDCAVLVDAVVKENLEAVKLLLAHQLEEHKHEALIQAMKRGNHEIIQVLKGAGADINGLQERQDLGLQTQLSWKIIHDRIDEVEWLLDNGADVNIRNGNNWTPLMYAAAFNQPNAIKIAKMLIEHGVDINAVNNQGHTALQMAIARNNPKFVQWLIAYTQQQEEK